MVTVVENNGVLGDPGGIQISEVFASDGVGLRNDVVVLGPILTDRGIIWMKRRQGDLRWIVNRLVRSRANFALMTYGGVEDREEGLAVWAIAPVRFGGRFIPEVSRQDEVVVFLRIVGAVVARISEEGGVGGFTCWCGHFGPHIVSTGGRRVEPANESGPSRGTYRGGRPGEIIAQTPGGEGVEMGCRGKLVTVATHLWAMIFAGDPENVRPINGRTNRKI